MDQHGWYTVCFVFEYRIEFAPHADDMPDVHIQYEDRWILAHGSSRIDALRRAQDHARQYAEANGLKLLGERGRAMFVGEKRPDDGSIVYADARAADGG